MTPHEVEAGIFSVESLTNPGTWYVVNPAAGVCSCPSHQKGGRRCKHLKLVDDHLLAQARQGAKGEAAGEGTGPGAGDTGADPHPRVQEPEARVDYSQSPWGYAR